jgi:hypothetical protein
MKPDEPMTGRGLTISLWFDTEGEAAAVTEAMSAMKKFGIATLERAYAGG